MSNDPADTPDFDHLDLLMDSPSTAPAASPSESGPALLPETPGLLETAGLGGEPSGPALGTIADDLPPVVDEGAEKKADAAQEEEQEKKPGLLGRLLNTDPYTVLLMISLACIVAGCGFLYLTWAQFNFDTKARGARVSAVTTIDHRLVT